MSTTGIEAVLSRAMSDAAFADLLFINPEMALSGYDLTTQETARLKGMSRADFDALTKASPDERKSFVRVHIA